MEGFCALPKLLELNLEENEISDFRDIRDCPLLKSLILAKNKIKRIKAPLPFLPCLKHISVAENEITGFTEILNMGNYK